MSRASRLSEFLVPVAALCGWVMVSSEVQAAPPPDARGGIVYVIGGVGGFSNLKLSTDVAVALTGLDHEVRGFDWSHGKGKILRDLQDSRHLTEKARELAVELRRAREAEPNRPIFVIAKSGGTGLALAALEQLPPKSIERLILLSAAVSPTYDLRPALLATRGEVVSFYSDLDWFILGWGTTQFGTIDRVYGPAAGLTGFKLPQPADKDTAALYGRVVQVRWSPAMLLDGHTGGHMGTSMPAFVAREVSPWLRP